METQAATLNIASSTYRHNETIPERAIFDSMGCTGQNRSPDLSWSGAPEGTKSYAVTLWDPDAPTGVGFVHWVLFNILGNVTSLAAGAGAQPDAGVNAIHGTNDIGARTYIGPCPPPGHGTHHYHLTVYALDVPKLELEGSATYALLRFVLRGHVLAWGEIVGLYGREG